MLDQPEQHGQPFDPVENARWEQMLASRRLRFVDGFKFGMGLLVANLIFAVIILVLWGTSVAALLSQLLKR